MIVAKYYNRSVRSAFYKIIGTLVLVFYLATPKTLAFIDQIVNCFD